MAGKRGRILVIRGGAIGDFILTLPAIAALRETFPHTHVDVLGYPVVAELACAAGLVDTFRSIEARPLAGFFARNGALNPELSGYFESCSIILSYLYDPDEIFKTNVIRTTKAQFIQGRHRPLESEDRHATSVFLQPLEKLAIYDADPLPRLPLRTAHLGSPESWLAVHPGSGSEKKNWAEVRWIELLQRLAAEFCVKILLVGGEAEGGRLQRIASRLPAHRVQLMEKQPLVQLASRLLECRGFIGHDSGITHIAAALGLKAVVLWGPSRAEIWRPLSPRAKILLPESGLEALPVETVARVVHQHLIG